MIARLDMCGHPIQKVNSEAQTPHGGTALMQFLADDHRVGAVDAANADTSGRARPPKKRGLDRPFGEARVAVAERSHSSKSGRDFTFGERGTVFSSVRAPGVTDC